MAHTYGAIPSPPDSRDYKALDHVALGTRPPEYMPTELAPIAGQGLVGSCVAQTLALIKAYQEYRERGQMELYSTDFIYWNRKLTDYQGQGMITREALSNLVADGTPPKAILPGNYDYVPGYATTYLTDKIRELAKPQVISKYAACNTIDEIRNCIFANGPVAIITGVYDSFDNFIGWRLPEPRPGAAPWCSCDHSHRLQY